MGAEELEDALNRATRGPGAKARRMPFGARAKNAVFFAASDEARSSGHDYVGGEHILVALLGEQQGLAAHVLRSCGLSLEGVRAQVSRIGGADESFGRLDHNAEAQRIVELAQAEAKALDRERVETAHVLLALLDQSDGEAVRVVRELEREPQQLRKRLFAEIEAGHGDYESFSKAARDLVAFAEDEARQLDHERVGTEHVLLGLLRDEQSVGLQVLESRGVTPQRVREAVVGRVAGTSEAPAGPIPLDHHATEALELARTEARATGSYVNPEHVLLGVAGQAEGRGARVLRELDCSPDEVRNEVLRSLSASNVDRRSGFCERFTEGAAQVVVLAQEEARGLEQDHIGSGHILLGLLGEQENAAARALAALSITVERVREQVVRVAGSADAPTPALLPFAPGATAVFELAGRDARWLEHDQITTDHLVLAILREDEGVGGRVLDELAADRDVLRAQALIALGAAWASGLYPAEEELSRSEQFVREAQAWNREATTDKERRERGAAVELLQLGVDAARAKLLPADCQDALAALADFATEEWLKGQPPATDAGHRRWYRDHCATNIHAQLLGVLLHPALGPEANPILGHPGGPEASDPHSSGVPFSLGS